MEALRRATRTLPIVLAGVSDPVGSCLVASLARPGGNISGFALPEYGFSVKWLELLKEIAQHVTRVAVLSGVGSTPGIGQLAALQVVGPSMRVDLEPLVVGDAGEIEATISTFSGSANGGLIILLRCMNAAHGTDRRTAVHGQYRRYRESSRQWRGVAAGGRDSRS